MCKGENIENRQLSLFLSKETRRETAQAVASHGGKKMAFSSGQENPLSFLESGICLAEAFRIPSRNPRCQLDSEEVHKPLQAP